MWDDDDEGIGEYIDQISDTCLVLVGVSIVVALELIYYFIGGF